MSDENETFNIIAREIRVAARTRNIRDNDEQDLRRRNANAARDAVFAAYNFAARVNAVSVAVAAGRDAGRDAVAAGRGSADSDDAGCDAFSADSDDADCDAATGMAPEHLMMFEPWHYFSLSGRFFGKLQLEYKRNDKFYPFSNYNQCLSPSLFYTDQTSCAMDGFNLGIGRQVLTRENINVPFHPSKGITYEQMRPSFEQAGYALDKLYVKRAKCKRQRNPPSLKQLLGFKSGVFLCEFYWKIPNTGENDYHVVAVNCDQRHVFCNTLGVIPFAARQRNESEKTHATVSSILRNANVYRVYRIIERK